MAKHRRKQRPADSSNAIEQPSEGCSHRLTESQSAANDATVDAPVRSRHPSKGNGKAEEKEGKPKVTIAEAAAKIDAADLTTFLVKSSEIMLMRFADYFESAFSSVSSAQFPLVELFREYSVGRITNILLSYISDDVHRESTHWIIDQPIEALSSFVLRSVDCICADFESQQASSKNAKKVVQDVSSKSQVGIFVALAIVLRQSPYALVNVLPTLRGASKYQGQDKFVVVAWMIEQVSQADLAVGLYSWAHNLLPIVNGKSSNPQSVDIILRIVEKILSSPKAQSILDSGVIRNGERLIPPFALEILIRVTFPLSSSRIEATKRFEAIYPTLKQVALGGNNPMEEEALEILSFATEAAGESKNVHLSNEATSICTWCLSNNAKCYKLWMAKRRLKHKPCDSSNAIEQQSEECSRRLTELQRAANAAIVDAQVRSRHQSADDEDENEDDSGDAEEAKPKVTVGKVASKIDAAGLATFMVKSSEIQSMRFADYFVRAFSAVSSAQFPWVKMFRENSVAKMTTILMSHISDAVYKASKDWIDQQHIEVLSSFVLWSLNCIFADLAIQQASSENSKNVAQEVSSKSQVGIFVALAMVLRGRPCALVDILPLLRETSDYQGQDMLSVVAWMIAQVSLGDLAVGLHSWARNLLPYVNGNSLNGDIILEIVEVILSTPNARSIFKRRAIINGESLIPPSALEILIRVAFPPVSSRIKATERFEAIYPTLKEVALANLNESNSMEEVALQILSFVIESAGESENVRLSNEAASICTWCLIENEECYDLWDTIYLENLKASTAILKNMYVDKKYLKVRWDILIDLRITLENFRRKNKETIASGGNVELLKVADKYCKALLRRLYWDDWYPLGMIPFLMALFLTIAWLAKYLDKKSC